MAGDQRGFTIVEVIVASFVLLVGVLATLALFDRANAATVVDRQREAATSLAREITEGARSVPFDHLVSATSLNTELQKMPGLRDLDGDPYTIPRGRTAFTVATEVCTADDAKDGGRTGPSSIKFCDDTPGGGPKDSNPEDYRRVTVTVSWRNNGVVRSVTQTEIVNNPGSGPGVLSVVPVVSPLSYVIKSTDPNLTLEINTSTPAKVISWSVDGIAQPTTPAPPPGDTSGLVWRVNWLVAGLPDGAYVITADAFDANSTSGPSRSETITLNRYVPDPPTGLVGGWNGLGDVDMEWRANTERDIVGYEVERTNQSGGDTSDTGEIVSGCSFAEQKLATSCRDSSPLNDNPIYYHVRAYDRDPDTGAPRAGNWSAPLAVVKSNERPYAPLEPVTATTTGRGTSSAVVTLTFGRPDPEDPDEDDSIAFFRIYRDGTRYDRWYGAGTTLTWQDGNTGGTSHTYQVSAVDTRYGESPKTIAVIGG